MDKNKLEELFENLLQDWKIAQETAIQEFGSGDQEEYEELARWIEEYRIEFKTALEQKAR